MVLFGKQFLFILAAVFLLPVFSYAQNPLFNLINNTNTGLPPINEIPDKIVGCYAQGNIYAITANNAYSSILSISEVDLIANSSKLLTIKKSKANSSLFGRSVLAISVQGNKLYVLNSSYLNILIIEGGHLKFYKTIANKSSFNCIHQLGANYLLLSVNYNFHPSDEPYKHTWSKLDIANDSLYPENHREEANARFSYFTNSWLSTYKGLIAYARTSDYTIKFYNDKFVLRDSIITGDFDSNSKFMSFIPKGNEYSTDEMKRISAASDTLLYRIEKIFLIDSARLLVTIKQPKSKIYRFDLWKKSSDKWERIGTQFLESAHIAGKRYTPDNNQISGFFGNYSIVVSDEKGFLYNYYFPFRNNVITDSFNMERDYIEPLNDLTRKNQLFFGVRKFRIIP